MRTTIARVLVTGVLALAVGAGARAAQESKGPPSPSVDTAACLTCHDAAATGMKHTPHASLEKSCVACHDAAKATEHMNGQVEGNNVPGPSLKKLSVEALDTTCL